jgi:hypothetical protein
MQNYYVAIKAEPVSIGVPDVTVTGAKKMRLNEFTAPELARDLITPGEIKSNGQSPRGRPGSVRVQGTLPMDLYYTEADDYFLAAVRATAWVSNVLTPGVTARSHTIELRDQDLGASYLTNGWRFGGFRISGAPDEPIKVEFPGMGIKQPVPTVGAAFYDTPSLSTTDYMDAVSCVIEVDGSPVLDVTSFDFTFDNGLSVAKVVGSPYSPNVYAENATLSGSLSALRTTIARSVAYINATDFDFVVTGEDPAGNQMVFTFKNLLYTSDSQPMGNAGPPIQTLNVVGGQVGSDNMVEIERVAA